MTNKKVLFVCLILVSLFAQHSLSAQDQPAFVSINSEGELIYRDQKVVLKGANFENVPALGATIGDTEYTIGSGNIDDINVTEADYALLSSFGANTVRFGLDFGWYKADRAKFFQVLDQHVAWARANNLWMIWNMFTTPGNCYEGYNNYCGIWDNPAEQTELRDFWLDMAAYYKNEEVVLGYDLLNEPTPPAPDWSKTWFNLAEQLHEAILQVDTNHLIFIESTSDVYFDRLFGANTVYEVHLYTPVALTHADEDSDLVYPGNTENWDGKIIFWDKNSLSGKGDAAANLLEIYDITWAREQKVPMFVGEWGTRSTYPGYEQYVRDIAELLNEWELHHTTYGWRHDSEYWKWGVYPESGDLVTYDQPKLDAMILSWQGAIKPEFSSAE